MLPELTNLQGDPVNPGSLLADLHDGSLSTLDIASNHGLTLLALAQWITSPEVSHCLATLRQAELTRTRAIAAAAAPAAAKALADLTTHDQPDLRRKAATTTIRIASGNPPQTRRTQHPHPQTNHTPTDRPTSRPTGRPPHRPTRTHVCPKPPTQPPYHQPSLPAAPATRPRGQPTNTLNLIQFNQMTSDQRPITTD